MTHMTNTNLKQTNYPQAPVIEAVIDLKVSPANDIDFSKFELAVREKFQRKYPKVSKQFQNESRTETRDYPQTSPVTSLPGLRFTSENDKQILQLKKLRIYFQ